jgi:MFS family permease
MSFITRRAEAFYHDKKQQVVLFSSTAIAVSTIVSSSTNHSLSPCYLRPNLLTSANSQLYGYDQGMMSLINTNHDYLATMGISSTSAIVGLIVSVYYLGCAVGAVFFSWFADRYGRKKGIFFCISTAALGNLIMFLAGLGGLGGGRTVMFIGRVVMGLGVGGVDCVIPIYSAELADDAARGRALAQEFQMNIFGLNMAFGINLGVTRALGKDNQWAWRIPIIVMQSYPLILLAVIGMLPESPRWCLYHGKEEASKAAMMAISGEGEGEQRFKDLVESQEQESDEKVGYIDMLTPGHAQFHPTMVAIMGQVNQVSYFLDCSSSH